MIGNLALQQVSGRNLRAPIVGNNLVRLLYLDEAGISKRDEEPYLVVAGMIVHGDRDWKPLQARIDVLVREYIPEEDREDFVFHATELFSGGKYFTREKWPREKRWEILRKLVSIPHAMHLPVISGWVDRSESIFEDSDAPDVLAHTMAFCQCLISAERWMRYFCENDVAMVIAEDTQSVKPSLKGALRTLRDPKRLVELQLDDVPNLPLQKIVDTVHFAGKRESGPLQIADACAFVLKRHLMGKADITSFYELLRPVIHVWAR
jgi:hypothetical protein